MRRVAVIPLPGQNQSISFLNEIRIDWKNDQFSGNIIVFFVDVMLFTAELHSNNWSSRFNTYN